MEELKKALNKKNDENVKFYTGSKIIDYLKVCLILLDHTVFYADGSSEGARNIMRRALGNCFFKNSSAACTALILALYILWGTFQTLYTKKVTSLKYKRHRRVPPRYY